MVRLNEISTRAPESIDKSDTEDTTEELAKELGELQTTLFAENKHSLLVVLQGMDSSGKNSSTQAAFEKCSPAGIRCFSFKAPTEEELSHDFLWRVHQKVPAKRMIHIFNRSHYEDILIQRVHNWINEERVHRRMASINSFEELLQYDNHTTVLKFYLHISAEDQKKELQERIDEPEKNWKHNPNDWEEAKLWDQYMEAYEYAINNSTIPWHIIPADQSWYRNYLVTSTIVDTLKSLNMKRPVLDESTMELK
ncbi:PPK2 family polyphosphate kinase [Membranihabitans maritimus]|uniref:PPK2 family polyphosphate kinase n=1 Tax=Membranihabitans maritimus TaxID=2904244 RepID=UPI001F23B15E|nr:PPK2 family polyphosphate kinase [Membranihabitans maritimus]